MKKTRIAALVGVAMGISLPAAGLAAEGQTDAMQDTASQMQTAGKQQQGAGIMQMQVSELKGKSIVNANGEDLGKVQEVARDDQGQLHVVLSVGGFLGFGAQKVAIPVSQLTQTDGGIATDSPITADELKDVAKYDEDAYQKLEGDMSLAEASQPSTGGATGTTSAEQASFEQLDRDGDGYISRSEAQASERLARNWQSADSDADDRLDRQEFSAFEAEGGAMQQEQTPSEGMPQGQMQPQQEGMQGEASAGGTDELASFDQLDSDGDGYISAQEAQQSDRLSAQWQDADANADGQLNRAEFSAFEAGRELEQNSEQMREEMKGQEDAAPGSAD